MHLQKNKHQPGIPGITNIDLRRDQPVDRIRLHCCISIDRKQILEERRVDTNHILDLVVHLQFERVHGRTEVNLHIKVKRQPHNSTKKTLTLFKKCMITI